MHTNRIQYSRPYSCSDKAQQNEIIGKNLLHFVVKFSWEIYIQCTNKRETESINVHVYS